MRLVEFATGCFYHIYNRGVDKRHIFKDKEDFYRFIKCLYECNDISHIKNIRRKVLGQSKEMAKERVCLVDIICFCLMPNHFHLLLRQVVDNGISKFMQKLEASHAMYFNIKTKRKGTLFEGRFEAKHIETDEYLEHLSRYIHLNPAGLIEPKWKEEGIKDWNAVNNYLENYKWSSYINYIGGSNFPSIINKEPMQWYFKTPGSYKKFVQSWVIDDMNKIEELILE